MACHSFKSKDGNIQGHICFINIFEYKGYVFEFHPYCGFTPYKKNLSEPRKTIPSGFWDMVTEFIKLSKEEKTKYQIYG